ncbi:MAG: thrombospondin type 3 repeat-containing protein, partial [Nitrospirota bacterium]|nr:thrombospondin type 3 repeat-containing protein [Nitrospirota bacterium]
HRNGAWSNDSILFVIDSLADYLSEASIRNFAQWQTLGQYVWPNYYIGNSYDEEIQIMRDWTTARLEWMDFNLPGMCTLGCTDELACNYFPGAMSDDGSCEYAEIYYDCFGNCINDSDEDSVCDELDNCPELYNPDQLDLDENGVGDDCEVESIEEGWMGSVHPLIKATDLSGREVSPSALGMILLHYSDGRVEKRVNTGR